MSNRRLAKRWSPLSIVTVLTAAAATLLVVLGWMLRDKQASCAHGVDHGPADLVFLFPGMALAVLLVVGGFFRYQMSKYETEQTHERTHYLSLVVLLFGVGLLIVANVVMFYAASWTGCE